ncbi:glycoside hydrolase family 88 protein [Paenibacillus sp. MMS18-CY102]|uniref:glycoside hydrolase family 88 protein n=1 Tax=Paenibacillus sp. MMS18-CY102 TaxID=2682849 RepID=UPI001365A6D5|nr:glycoside hydrolase family 88 protein [Paenibacillus sp. MMS18-CY102]MWC27886.1 glycosyl hydrolase [Paenibacillus sp. MMS18-CY102]
MDAAYKAKVMERIERKAESMLAQIGDKSPHVARADGLYDDMPHWWWTSGFWPGMLWLMHDWTGNDAFKQAAWDWDSKLEQCFLQHPVDLHHDVGFQFLPTAVIKHQLTGDQEALRIGLRAADFMAGRFNPAGNFIRAWNGDLAGWAIIDCMMNLPLLFWASRESGDPRYKHIAMRHADTILTHGLRPDGSVVHILSFNPETGEFIEPLGGQGHGPDSAWSRGNAWALYGFALAYRYTGEQRYLDAAKRTAHHFIACLPDDAVPLWDFRVDQPESEPRDSSAAAIAASGLIEIAEHVPQAQKHIYQGAAERILESLTERYATWDKPEHQAILLEGTGHKPAGENVNVSIIYGDYYYIEAFAKLNGWQRRIF